MNSLGMMMLKEEMVVVVVVPSPPRRRLAQGLRQKSCINPGKGNMNVANVTQRMVRLHKSQLSFDTFEIQIQNAP